VTDDLVPSRIERKISSVMAGEEEAGPEVVGQKARDVVVLERSREPGNLAAAIDEGVSRMPGNTSRRLRLCMCRPDLRNWGADRGALSLGRNRRSS